MNFTALYYTIIYNTSAIIFPIIILISVVFRVFRLYERVYKYTFFTDVLLFTMLGLTYYQYYYVFGTFDKYVFSFVHSFLYIVISLYLPLAYYLFIIKYSIGDEKYKYVLFAYIFAIFSVGHADGIKRGKTTFIYHEIKYFFVDRPPSRNGIYYIATIEDIKKETNRMVITLKSDYNGENCISLKTKEISDSLMQILSEGNQLLMHDESNKPCSYPDLSVKITECINKYNAPIKYYKKFIYPANSDYILNKEGVNIVYRADTEYSEGDSSIVTVSFTDICGINHWELFDSSKIKRRNKILLFRNVKRDSTYTILNVTEQFANSCEDAYYYYEMDRIYEHTTLERWYPELYEYKSVLMLESPLYNNTLYFVYKSKVVSRDSNEVKLQFKDIFENDKTISYSCKGFEVPDTLLIYKNAYLSKYFVCSDDINTSENWSKISYYGYTMGYRIYTAKEVEDIFPDAKDVCKQNLLPK